MTGFDFLASLAGICILCLAAFILPSLPRWIWAAFAFSYLMTLNVAQMKWEDPGDEKAMCEKKCKEIFGDDQRFFMTRPYCVEKCLGKV